ncbi:hypothetical protein IQ268_09220 [Oculatella sp. LEGE 06141]|uniref:hypothetical protein n=1 Tax=Oculatella sp. LEGE 06141 TaxID=1828648 RepID=UPI001882F157|nr:hypothetical protein [Oculatella sp. LEGE 06141]MBE9178739.1 hypothetical protein [Oculatella sp. LEGE 06141]
MTTCHCPAPITLLDRDYLQILDQLIKNNPVSRAVRFCAAKLLQIFERQTRWKMEAYQLSLKNCWFWIPIIKPKPPTEEQLALWKQENREPPPRSLHEELQGEHCKDIIRAALNLINDLALVQRRHNPYNGQDRTYQYQADLKKLEQLKTLLEATSKKSPLEGDTSSLEGDTSSLEGDTSSLEGDTSPMITTNNSPSFSQTTSALSAVENEEEESEPLSGHVPASPLPPDEPPIQEPETSGEDMPSADSATDFSAQLIELGIEDNRTVRKEMEQNRDRIPNALAYVRQEVGKRWVRNPTGLFIKALRQGKKPAQNSAPEAESQPRIDLRQVEDACIIAWSSRDRDFIRAKLQMLCECSHVPEAKQLCDRYPAWGFVLGESGIEEVNHVR